MISENFREERVSFPNKLNQSAAISATLRWYLCVATTQIGNVSSVPIRPISISLCRKNQSSISLLPRAFLSHPWTDNHCVRIVLRYASLKYTFFSPVEVEECSKMMLVVVRKWLFVEMTFWKLFWTYYDHLELNNGIE